MSLGSRIRQAREQLGLTQKEAAERLGISNVVLNRYEKDERQPDPKMIALIAESFRVSSDYLLGTESSNDISPIPPWMGKLTPQTRTRLEAVGGLRNFHTRFLGGTSLNDLDQHDLEIIMQVYFRHLEASEKKRKAKEKEDQ